jgi:hypothetical protein
MKYVRGEKGKPFTGTWASCRAESVQVIISEKPSILTIHDAHGLRRKFSNAYV